MLVDKYGLNLSLHNNGEAIRQEECIDSSYLMTTLELINRKTL